MEATAAFGENPGQPEVAASGGTRRHQDFLGRLTEVVLSIGIRRFAAWQAFDKGLAQEDVPDLLNEAWARTLRAHPIGRREDRHSLDSHLIPYVRRVIENEANRKVKKAARQREKEKRVAALPPQVNDEDHSLFSHAVVSFLASAKQKLTPQRFQVFMYHLMQYNTAEIAAIMGISEAAVRQLLARARRQLRELLDEREEPEDD